MSLLNLLNKWGNQAGALSVGLAVAGYAIQTCCFVVPAGHRAIIWDRKSGIKPNSLKEGLQFRIPYFQIPHLYETRTRSANINTETVSADLQTVSCKIRLLYRPSPEYLAQIHSRYGPNYDEKILPSIGTETLKAVIARFNADELINSRELVSSEISTLLKNKAKTFNIVLEDAALIHIEFSPEYSKAVELKVIAKQESARYGYLVEVAEEERRANVIRAEGESEAAKLIMKAMEEGEGFLELKKIETAKELSAIFAQNSNVTYLPNKGNLLLGLNKDRL